MGKSLKDALKDAGFKGKKSMNERETVKKKDVRKEAVKHQAQRNFCEVCELIQPDVELYKHRNPVIHDAEWICSKCADENMVADKFRETNQSDFAKKKRFMRQFGETKKF